jgi:hypothetical protein
MQKRPNKIVAQKRKHQVGVLASGERGVNTTVMQVSAYCLWQTLKQRNGITRLRSVPFYATEIWPVDRHVFQEPHFAAAGTAQPSSSETQYPETSLGTQSDSEDRDGSSRDEDYECFRKTLQ